MKNFDKIEKYLLGKLSEHEKKEFENQIDLDQQLAAEVELQRIELHAIDTMDKNNLRANLMSLRAEIQSEGNYKKKSSISYLQRQKYLIPILTAAAAIALLIGVFSYFSNKYSNEHLFQLAYQLEKPNFGTLRNNSQNDFDAEVVSILLQKNKSEVTKAIQYFQTYKDENNPLYQKARLNLGHAYLLRENFENAALTFKRITNSNSSNDIINQAAEYYQAISLLGGNKEKEAVTLFQKIEADSNHRYRPSAREMLEKMNSFWRRF